MGISFKAIAKIILVMMLGTAVYSADNKELPKVLTPMFYQPAATGPFNLFPFLLGKNGPNIEKIYFNLVNLDKNRDENGKLRLTPEGKKDLAGTLMANKKELYAVDNYLNGTLVIVPISGSTLTPFHAPFDFSVEKPIFLNLKDWIQPTSRLAEIDEGIKFVLKTKDLGVVVMFIGYSKKSLVDINFVDTKTKLLTKTTFKEGEALGDVAKGRAYMCLFFNRGVKIDTKTFMQK